jgi:biotin carboxylase
VSSSNKKTLLVLAASGYQIEAITTARRLGFGVITTDNRPDNPGHKLADRAYSVDTRDVAGVLEIARRERVDGLLAPCTDVAMPTLAVVAAKMGLPGPPVEATRIVCDKSAFRAYQHRQGLPHPRHFLHTAGDDLPSVGACRWIVKPCQSSGSKGIRVVESERELAAALPEALKVSLSATALVEEFLPGHQGTCEGWLSGGQIVWHCLLDRQTVPLPHVATCGHRLPTILTRRDQDRVVKAIAEVWTGLGVTDGPFDCDFVVNDESVFILELSPRLGGNAISQLVNLAFGFNLVERTVRWACREDAGPLPPALPRPAAVMIFGADRPGRLRYNEAAAAELAANSWVNALSIDFPPGSPVELFTDGRRRVGQALLTAESRVELDDRVMEITRRLAVSAA